MRTTPKPPCIIPAPPKRAWEKRPSRENRPSRKKRPPRKKKRGRGRRSGHHGKTRRRLNKGCSSHPSPPRQPQQAYSKARLGDQNAIHTYPKIVLLACAFRPAPLKFVLAPSNLSHLMYCNPIRAFSHGQNDGPPRMNGK